MTEPFIRNAIGIGGSAILVAVGVASEAGAGRPLSPKEAARALDVSDNTIRRWIADGDLPALRVGGRYRLTREAVEGMVKPAHGGEA